MSHHFTHTYLIQAVHLINQGRHYQVRSRMYVCMYVCNTEGTQRAVTGLSVDSLTHA